MNIILYTTHCPKCEVLAAKLNNKEIVYSIVEDVNIMENLGIDMVPCLSVNGKILNFSEAVKWINEE